MPVDEMLAGVPAMLPEYDNDVFALNVAGSCHDIQSGAKSMAW